jgi:hypothetical protein
VLAVKENLKVKISPPVGEAGVLKEKSDGPEEKAT